MEVNMVNIQSQGSSDSVLLMGNLGSVQKNDFGHLGRISFA